MSGKYRITLNTPMGVESGILELKANGNTLSGTINSNKLNSSFSNGRIVGNNIIFSGKIKMAMIMTINYNANCTIDNGKLWGIVQTSYGNFHVQGNKM